MLPSIGDLAKMPTNYKDNRLTKAIRKVYYPDLNLVGVLVRKRTGELKGMVAWRLYRTTPADGETEFGREFYKFKQYYLGGGYTFSYEEAQKILDRAVTARDFT